MNSAANTMNPAKATESVRPLNPTLPSPPLRAPLAVTASRTTTSGASSLCPLRKTSVEENETTMMRNRLVVAASWNGMPESTWIGV